MNLMLINNRTHFIEVKLFLSNFSHIISVDCHFTLWRSILILSQINIFIPIKRNIAFCTISRIDFFYTKSENYIDYICNKYNNFPYDFNYAIL